MPASLRPETNQEAGNRDRRQVRHQPAWQKQEQGSPEDRGRVRLRMAPMRCRTCQPVHEKCKRRAARRSGGRVEGLGTGVPPSYRRLVAELSASVKAGRTRKAISGPTGGLPPSGLYPRNAKGPLAGAFVSFSLVRPQPDMVIGTTRRFQPWRELPSWLRAGGSVR